MYSDREQDLIRRDIFRWLDEKQIAGQYEFTREELVKYEYQGDPIPLLDRGRGIRNPKQLSSTLSVLTSFDSPYVDTVEHGGLVRYRYRSDNTSDNAKLRVAFEQGDPFIYFQGVRKGVYVAVYPVYAIADDPVESIFSISLDESTKLFADPLGESADQRRYSSRVVQVRLHQPVFRAKVMTAYSISCAVCDLKHARLLDAAHILPDAHVDGFARVTNGLALCKIHHAAFDSNILGITADFQVKVDEAIMQEVDGPMLRHGLQEMDGRTIRLPRRAADHPSQDSLALRFEEFAAS
jgi:putative restriction endonuclease